MRVSAIVRRLVFFGFVGASILLQIYFSRRYYVAFLTEKRNSPPSRQATPVLPPSSSSRLTSTLAEENIYLINNDEKDTFDYKAYWDETLNAALATSEAKPWSPSLPCPKVYVYNLPEHLTDSIFSHPLQIGWHDGWYNDLLNRVYGSVSPLADDASGFDSYLRDTHMYAFASILEYRLRISSECRTTDPNQADLFFVPVLTKPKFVNQWRRACKHVRGDTIEKELPFLNATNACRHFFAAGEAHYCLKRCKGWFHRPSDRLRPFQRVAYSHVDFDKNEIGGSLPRHSRLPKNQTDQMFPNLVSVPFATTFHFSGQQQQQQEDSLPQFSNFANRTLLMSFIGNDFHGDVDVRKRIVQQCLHYHHHVDPNLCQTSDFTPQLMATTKTRAVFCLEPAGDGPWRKSIYDTITMGCIPVVFSELTDDVAPWYWQDLKPRARVLVPRQDFVEGRIDLRRFLQSIPPRLVRLMQETLKQRARAFQYSLHEDEGDGIRVVLDGLYRRALDMERRGVCGY